VKHAYAYCPPKVGRKINPLLKGLDDAQISFLRHRLAGAMLAFHRAEEAAAAEAATQGWILFQHSAHDEFVAAKAALRDARMRVAFAEAFRA
jgi:hypothetical protein